MVQPYNEGHKLEQLMTELNAYYNDPGTIAWRVRGPGSRRDYFAARHTEADSGQVKVVNVQDAENAAVR